MESNSDISPALTPPPRRTLFFSVAGPWKMSLGRPSALAAGGACGHRHGGRLEHGRASDPRLLRRFLQSGDQILLTALLPSAFCYRRRFVCQCVAHFGSFYGMFDEDHSELKSSRENRSSFLQLRTFWVQVSAVDLMFRWILVLCIRTLIC